MSTRILLLALLATALTACASHRAPRVRCDRHLEPINILITADDAANPNPKGAGAPQSSDSTP